MAIRAPDGANKKYCENPTVHPQDYRILSTSHSTSVGDNIDPKKRDLFYFFTGSFPWSLVASASFTRFATSSSARR